MTYSCVLAFGDSTVAGVELADVQSAFPHLVAQHLGIPCHNMAWGGGSNYRSLRLLPETLLRYPGALVLFYYTNWQRTEWFCEDRDPSWPCDPTGYTPIGSNWVNDGVPSSLERYIKTWITNFDSDPTEHNNYREYNAMFTVQTLCQALAADYVQIFGFADGIHNKTAQQQIILDNLDRKHWLRFPGNVWSDTGWNLGHGNFYEWAGHHGFSMGKSHYLEPAHRAMAELIIKHLEGIS